MKRYLKKSGDRRDCYAAGMILVLKWQRTWRITKVTYNKDVDVTTIRIEQ